MFTNRDSILVVKSMDGLAESADFIKRDAEFLAKMARDAEALERNRNFIESYIENTIELLKNSAETLEAIQGLLS